MWLIVGLGNPGKKYLLTRHNVGFMAIDNFARSVGAPPPKKEFKAEISKFKLDGEDVILAMPTTFMNLSGESVGEIATYYKVPLEKTLIIHDEVDIPFGAIKLQKSRGAGGHNGIKSIHQHLNSPDYLRLRLGVGRPPHPQMEVAAYVLQNFSAEEQGVLTEFLNRTSDAIESIIFEGFERTASTLNQKN